MWPAFWMLGTNITTVGWPGCGEIDIMENIGREPTLVHGTVHGPGYSGGNGIGGPCALPGNPVFADAFHTYAIEWRPDQIKWFVDGTQYFSVNPARLPAGKSWVFNQPQFLLLNLAVGGSWPGNPDGTTSFPQQFLVDYVRVYAGTNLPARTANLLSNPGFESGLQGWTGYGDLIGNTLAGDINSLPVYNGTNVFKVYGQFTGSDNYSGLYQDLPAGAGQAFSASARALTPANDQIAGANSAWIEVTFRDAAAHMLSLYRSASIDPASPPGLWLPLAVTNQFDPNTFAPLGSVSELVAPPNTSFVRCQVVFHQPGLDAGAALFDDTRLVAAGTAQIPVPVTATRSGGGLYLGFPTYLGWPYQVSRKTYVNDPAWSVLTNLCGDGQAQSFSTGLEGPSGFFQVTRVCSN